MAEISKQALKVENNTEFPNNNNGAITPSNLRAFNVDMIDSTVNQTQYNADSASWNSSIDALEAFTSSQQPSFTALNAFTASQLTINSGVNSFTSSADSRLDSLESEVDTIQTWTASVNEIRDDGVLQGYSTRLHFAGLVSASIVPNVGGAIASIVIEQDGTKLNSASFNAYTASTDSDLNAIHQATASLNSFTASLTTAFVSTASFNAFTQSADQRLDSLEAATSSYATSAITASSLVTASFDNGTRNLTFTKGDASTFAVNIPDVSGSTSINTGSFVTTSSFNAYTASQQTINSGYNTFTQSIQAEVDSLQAATSSYAISSSVAAVDAAQQAQINSLISATGSYADSASFAASQLAQDVRIDGLSAQTASYANSASVAAVDAAQQQQINSLIAATSSYVTESETASFARYDVSNPWSADQTFTNISAVSASFQYVQTIFETASVIYSSGSNQFGDASNDVQTLYGSTRIINELTASGLHYPTADNGAQSFIQTDGAGNLSLQYVKTLYQNIRNMETSSILLGTPLFVSGATGDNANVYIAQASNPLRYPATLIAGDATLAASATGKAIVSGEIKGPDTSLYTPGTVIYLGGNGGWTSTRPTGSATQVQILGVVTKQGNNGEGLVMNQLGTELPNIQEGYVWVGNVDGTPTAVATSSFIDTFDSSSLLTTASFNAYTASTDSDLASIHSFTSSADQRLDSIEAVSGSWITESETGSFAKLDANQIFTGNNTFTGNTVVSQSSAFGTASFYGPVVIDKGISGNGNITANGNLVANKVSAFDFDSLFYGSQLGGTTANGTFFGYGSTNYTHTLGAYAGGFDNELQTLVDNTGIYLKDFNGSGYNTFLKLNPNSGNNPKPIMTRGLEVTGSTNIAELTASLAEGYVWVGDASGKTTTIATSSFASLVNTGSFATTGSNTFTGQQNIQNNLVIEEAGNPLVYTQFIQQPLTGRLAISQAGATGVDIQTDVDINGTLTASLAEGYVWVGGASGRTTTLSTASFVREEETGSFATTGSNAFVGVESIGNNSGTGVGEVYLLGNSGSLVIGNSTATPTYASLAHISSSQTNGNTNLIFKNSTTAADTIVSGSANIFANPAAPTTGFKRYVGTSNIFTHGSSVPQISGSMAFSPSINGNILSHTQTNALTFRGPVSSSAASIIHNILMGGTITLGTSAANNFEKATAGVTVSGNAIFNGNVNAVANTTTLTSTPVVSGNLVFGALVNLNMYSSSVTYASNIQNGGITINNSFSPTAGTVAGALNMRANVNTVYGTGHVVNVSGTNTSTTQGKAFSYNILAGTFISASIPTGDNSSIIATGIIGNGLVVTGSTLPSTFAGPESSNNSQGSLFSGRYNAIDGTKSNTGETIFAVGTGTSYANRKTGFLIDSGSNTYVEGSLNVSGSSLFNGEQIISGNVYVSGSINLRGEDGEGFAFSGKALNLSSSQQTGITVESPLHFYKMTKGDMYISTNVGDPTSTGSMNIVVANDRNLNISSSKFNIDGNQSQFIGNSTITGSLIVSGSLGGDFGGAGLAVQSRVLVSGPTTGATPNVTVSGSDANAIMRRFAWAIDSTPTPSVNPSLTMYGHASSSVSIGQGVFHPTNFDNIGELLITTTKNGTTFQDIRDGGDYSYNTWLTIPRNTNNDPKPIMNRGLEITGSVNISQVMNLKGQDPLPAGNIGDLAVSASHLWFYNGAWTQLD